MSLDPVSLAIQAGLMAANMALTASKTTEGPRLTDLSVTVADYGTPLAYFRGKRRLALPIIFAEKLREVKVQSKTKGGKFNDYKYYATFAAAVAGHQTGGVTRLWADKHLIYDATGAGPMTPFSASDDFNLLEHLRFYLGTEDQMPDPRMQATVEAEHGAGSCPAYRGVSYVMFEELPVEKFGNRVPQIEGEAITDPAPHYPFESKDGRLGNVTFSPDGSRMLSASGDAYTMWDCATRTPIISGHFPEAISAPSIANNGTIYGISGDAFSGSAITAFTADGLALIGTTPLVALYQAGLGVYADGYGREHVVTFPLAFITYFYTWTLDGLGSPLLIDTTDVGDLDGWTPRGACTDSHGDVWVVGNKAGFFGSWDDLYLYRIVDTDARPGSIGFVHLNCGHFDNGVSTEIVHADGKFFVFWGHYRMIAIDEVTMTIVGDVAISDNAGGGGSLNLRNAKPGSDSVWIGFSEISLTDGSTIRTVDPYDWKTEDSYIGPVYDRITNALISTPQYSDFITRRYLDRLGNSATTLGDVVDFVAGLAGIDPAHIDTSELTDTVDGWSWSQGTGKDILSPLFDVYDVDPREHGFVLAFKPRGDAAGATIDMADFVKGEQDDSPTHTVDRGQGTDTPRRLTVSFSDIDADQQTNSASVARPLDRVDGARELSIDMTPWAAHVDEARQKTERMHRRRWFGRETYTFGLTAQHVALEPGDVHLLTFDGVAKVARLTLCSPGADQVLHTEWERDDPSVAVLTGQPGAGFDGRAPSVILIAIPSHGFVLDIPLIRDADNDVNPLLYYAASPYVIGTWPGATILRSLDGGATFEESWASVPSAAPSTWGYAAEALGDADPWLWDRGNSVTIDLQYGTLTGATEAECNRNPQLNLALLGGELIQFTTPTLNGDGSWTLSGLKRGRRGTEWACGLHAQGDAFVLLTATGRVAMGASDVGDSDVFKAVTVGRDAASAFVIPLTFTGATLKPYAPAALRAVKDPATGDWAIDWVRRTRIGGAWTGGTTIPLGEASEEYALVVLDGAGAVVRTYSGLSSPAATYDAADQASDGGDVAEGDLNLAVYQISDTVGRGFAATGTF